MTKRLVFWFRVALVISILGLLFWSAYAFLVVHDLILVFPDELQYPNLWGAIAVICALFVPVIFAEVFALTFATSVPRIKALSRVLEVTCWLGVIAAIVVPVVFSVTQNVGHIAIVLFLITNAAVFTAGALFTRMRRQVEGKSSFFH
ncbi:hypothetical protein [Schaalia sp. ZJ1691]|uniref:hypothetical protein n=1 Tax=Schaalia sp. ZJ1691 TaxID=2709404 RepID=UPI0013ECE050|nr:hypothetical protein [Schaalia sp. ZJ1691]